MNIKTAYENFTNSFYDAGADSRVGKSIFVSIVSYRDKNIIRTIDSLISNAKRPENLTLSIVLSVYKNPEPWFADVEKYVEALPKNARVNLHLVDAGQVFNLGELRNMSHQDYNREDYYLSVSSASEFDPHWDDILIKEFDVLASNFENNALILTGNPRGWLPHDNIIPGYVYFTNHKTKVSMQREEYDSSRVLISGHNKHIINYNSSMPMSEKIQANRDVIHKNMKDVAEAEKFLEKYGFVKFSDRKFLKDEYVAISGGVSDRFIFAQARNYLKINKIPDYIIDREDYNFISFINFLRAGYEVLSIRWIPIYHLYDDDSVLSTRRPTPLDNYEGKDLNNEKSYKDIAKMVNDINTDIDSDHINFNINSQLGVDWSNKKFKELSAWKSNSVVDTINNCISFYNFSVNENTLHWNKRSVI